MPPRAQRRRRRHQLQQKHQSHPQKQLAELELGLAAASQPIFLVLSSEEELCVSRSMPEILSGHMENSSWNSFCNQLDEALLPLTKMKKTMKKWCFYPLALFVPLIVIGLVTTAILATRSMDDSSSGESMNRLLPLLFLIAFVASIPWAIGMASYSSSCKKNVTKEIQKICHKASTMHPGVSFKVFIELRYIQVLVASILANELEKADTTYANDETFSTCSSSGESVNTAKSSVYSITPEEFAEAKKWRTAVDESTDKVYYFNEDTQEVTWDHPLGFDRVNGDDENAVDKRSSRDSNGKVFKIQNPGPDAGIETSILFRQLSWETPMESDEGNGTEENKQGGTGNKKKFFYGEPEIDV
eukprot:CAMPEP_0172557490 /NCGR_PEP_ID=MMETSP1067-20121228/73498_1 /TAXON_ID=265564 ORGANISM="Thalassiosira punctigera, Strain Tpunct2005C2" /NCGR_SAMPLE_ID=MMETSP1067 /ASSEMBLY_ACC=CAM_ASM_000444 /LENGTH=357 /DNA_ID=CAMNT_0013346581 /DNA_START=144 /DNA_END=1217 /DNA_ORIENTATION=-